ncbi:hypothetical protein GCM10010168_29380 [Actinoplanes ianthinogenes]|uniref:Repeat protein (TIGR01451 family) n=1 Tax=Actinoplanes ianthinogenes TaxID=122358 RepID=A0ABN6C3K3_9ACTN|nr:DUF11 domain-containing protein [Actinoplanes ianthinogenes]BCJ40080.1 hypothetical protein Aiant_07370 [Actinoplanes ianthinogenes]GGR10136.1 hypothetical protein GCM10010168_29380 [Actinoplanes ianthinogenes]
MVLRRCTHHLLVPLLLALCCLLVFAPARQQPARAAQSTCSAPVSLINGDFEAPAIAANSMSLINEGPDMPGWKTTAPDHVFELWHEVRQNFNAGSGVQFVELNANYVSTLYQDVATTPGQTMRWELKHRGRLGTDVMAVKIGPAGGTLVQQGGPISDANTAWGVSSLNYTVPPGQTMTRFAFESVSAAQNKPTYGNFLDGISFGTAACLLTSTAVSAATANAGDTLTYTVNAENRGGNPAQQTVLSNPLPPGTTFVPGSIRSITGSSSTTVSDAADGDTGEYDAATRTVRVRAGTGAGGSAGGTIPVGEARSFSYQVKVTTAAAETTLGDVGEATYTEPISGSRITSTGSTATTAVAAAADLRISAAVGPGGVVAGRPATTALTVTNAGPSTAAAVQVTAVVPFGIVNVGATMPGATCTITGQNARCDLASMASGASGVMTVSGDLIPQATPGAQATLTSAVSSATYEVNQADNAASVSAAVATVADVGVTMTNTPGVAGSPITYTATVTNAGPSMARSLVLTDVIPLATATYTSAAGGTCAVNAIGSLECQLADMLPGATTTVTINMTLKASGGGAVNNAVSITSSTPDPSAANNNFSVQSAGTAVADVGVRLGLSQLSAYAGDTVTYTLTVTNYGPSDATNVTFATVTPPGVTIARNPPFCTPTVCTVGTLPAGASIPLSGTATLGPNAAAGPGFASTTVISPTTDNNAANDTDTINFTVLLRSDLSVTQTLSNSTVPGDPLVAGQNVTGVVRVTNNGQTRSEGVVLRQAVPAGWPVPTTSTTGGGSCTFQGTVVGGSTPDGGSYVCNLATLATSATWQITFAGVQLATGYSSTVYSRAATVSSSTPDPDGANDSVTTTAAVEQHADLEVVKVVTSSTSIVQSEEVDFEARVINHGPSDGTNVVLRESPDAGLSITSGTATNGTFDTTTQSWTIQRITPGGAPGGVLTLHGTALGSGTLNNSTRIIAADGTDPDPANNTATAGVTAAPAAPALSIVSTTTPSASPAGVGATIPYTYEVRNTGNLPMTSLTLSGNLSGSSTCAPTSVAVGAVATCTGSVFSVTATEVLANTPITDTVTAQALNTSTVLPATYAQLSYSVPVAVPHASLSVVLTPTVSTASRQNAAAKNDTIAYTYDVTNNGNVPMNGIMLTDTRGNTIACPPPANLAIGASMTCDHTPSPGYQVQQSDIDAGTPITNTATATSANPVGSFASPVSSVAVAAAAPALDITVVRTGSSSPVRVNDTISYQYTIRNLGNVGLDTVSVTDSNITSVNCPASVIAEGGTLVCTSSAPYTVVQGDIDAGVPVLNDAIVDARSVAPGHLPVSAESSVPVPVVGSGPALTVTTTAQVTPVGHAAALEPGDTIALTHRVRNTGNVTMRLGVVSDTLTGTAGCDMVTLPVGGTAICTGGVVYQVSQDDYDTGVAIAATTRVTARAPGEASASTYATTAVSVPMGIGSPVLTITTGATLVTPSAHTTAVEEGDIVAFGFLVTNAGTLSMRTVTVTDSRTGQATCPASILSPGGTMTCVSAGYTVRQADIDAGYPLTSTAKVSGRAGNGPVQEFGPAATRVPVVVGAPSLDAQAIGRVTPAEHQAGPVAGDTVTWTYRVVNNGNQTIGDVAVSGPGTIVCPQTGLTVREAMTCTTDERRVVTQQEVDRGQPITTKVSVAGRAPDGEHSFGPFSGTVAVVAGQPALDVELTVSAGSGNSGVTTGDLLKYTYVVHNGGNVTVGDVTVDHARGGTVACDSVRLAPGEATNCKAVAAYRVTQADVDAATPIVDKAVARGVVPGSGQKVASKPDSTTVPLAAPTPKLSGGQTAVWADTDSDGQFGPGDDVISTIVVTNTGNVTLINVRVTGLPAAVTCEATRLAPKASTICRSAVYHLTRKQIAAGKQTFEAKIAGDLVDPDADNVTADAPSTVAVPAKKPAPKPSKPAVPGHQRPPGAFPVTGQAAGVVVLIGLGLVVAGLVLFVATRGPAPGARGAHGAYRPAHRR